MWGTLIGVSGHNCAEHSSCRLQDRRGWTALFHCAKSGTPQVAKLLVAHGAALLLRDQAGKMAYDVASESGRLAVRTLLRPDAANLLLSDTVGAELARKKLAAELGLQQLGVVPATAQTTAPDGPSDGQTQLAPPAVVTATSLFVDNSVLHPHLRPQLAGVEHVPYMVAMSDKARWLACAPYTMIRNLKSGVLFDCKLCCWQFARPRTYVKVTENALEVNNPLVCCPCKCAIVDAHTKIHFDKMLSITPFRAKRCSQYHMCCGACEPCGQVVAFAPRPSCANETCLLCCPCCFTTVPGLEDAASFAAFINVQKEEFVKRTGAQEGSCFECLCFNKNA